MDKELINCLQTNDTDFILVIKDFLENEGLILNEEFNRKIHNRYVKEKGELDKLEQLLNLVPLSEDIHKVLENYIELASEKNCRIEEEYFKVGFRTGVKFMLQCIK